MEFEKLSKKAWTEMYIKKHFPDDYAYIEKFPGNSFSERIYNAINNNTQTKTCPVCGRPLKFINVTKGYRTVCSQECNYKIRYEKTKKTCLEKYGVENYSSTKECKAKVKQTCLERYGGIGTSAEQTKKKVSETCLEKYGVENYSSTKECKAKVKQTCLERYGGIGFASEKIKEKSNNTKLSKYNDNHYSNRTKAKQTCLEKYGGENPFATEETKDKIKQTCLEKYGVEHYSSTNEYKKKTKRTCLIRYGVENPVQLDTIQQKIKETKDKNHTHNASSVEEKFATWLKDNNINFVRQYKSDKYPFCCDFYFPDRDLYFEINGFWTHGLHPFDINNETDIAKLESWKQMNTKFYNNAINTWTVSDPLKVKTAKENKLNFKVIYSDKLNDVIKSYNETIS